MPSLRIAELSMHLLQVWTSELRQISQPGLKQYPHWPRVSSTIPLSMQEQAPRSIWAS